MKSENTNERATWWDESSSPAPAAHGHQLPHYVAQPVETRDPEPHNDGFDWDKLAFLVLAILLPPLGVFFEAGCGKDLAINGLLTLFGCVSRRSCDACTRVLTASHLLLLRRLQIHSRHHPRDLRDPAGLALLVSSATRTPVSCM